MGKKLWTVILVLFAAMAAQAQNYAVNGSCTLGGQATVTQGVASSGTRPLRGSTTFNGTGVMASYPGCTVTVYSTGTTVPATIYLTATGSAQSNPFTANLTDGSWVFFAPAGCYDIMISSGATQASTMPNAKTFPGVCAGNTGGGGGGGGTTAGTQVTVNGTAAVPNSLNFSNVLLPPSNGSLINFLLSGNTVGAYLAGNGNASNCLSGTGTWVACSGGGGGSGTLPTTPQYDLFASTGAGAAQASGVLGNSGFVRAQVYTATGDVTSASPGFQLFPNASVEYFPTGYANSQGNFGVLNGLALYMSHSGQNSATGNGGIALGGGNSSGTGNQIYVDCETTGCDFKVPLTVNGGGVGGGGGGLPTIPAPNLFASNGSGNAVDSGVLGQAGFLRAYVLEATGTGNASPFSVPNGSIEYFPTGGYGAGGANGVALHVSHSGSATGFGGIALAGGNTSGTDQLYLDCEGPPVVPALGCDFKVPITVNGAAVGGGSGTVNWGSIGGTLASQSDLSAALNAKIGLGGTLTPVLCNSGQAAGGILSNGNATGCFTPSGGGGGSGTVGSGTQAHFAWYSVAGTTVDSNPNLDDGATTAGTITSTEPIAAPQINVNGAVGTGIAMTGVGGTLPSVATGSGGVGIGPGGIPEINPNGTGWIAIPTTSGTAGVSSINGSAGAFTFSGAGVSCATTTCTFTGGGTGGSGTVGTGTTGQLAAYTAANTVSGTPAITTGAATIAGVTGNALFASVPITLTGGVQGVLCPGATASSIIATASNSIPGQFGCLGNAIPAIQYSGSGGALRPITVLELNGTLPNGNQLNLNGTVPTAPAAPVCTPAATANGRCISFQASGGSYSAELVGDGSTNCLSGQGTYVTCGTSGGGGVTGATANGGLVLSGSTLGLITTCAANQYLAWVSPAWTCTTPSPGGVGTGTVNQFAIYNGTNSVVGTPALTFDGSWLIANQPISADRIIYLPNSPLTSISGQSVLEANSTGSPFWSTQGGTFQPFVLGPATACAANQVLIWVSPNWTCSTPATGTVTGATTSGGLTLSGTTLGLQTCTANQYLSWVSGVWTCTAAPSGGGSGTVGTGASGQYALYNGTTSVAGDPNLTSNGTTITTAIPVAATQLIPGTGGILYGGTATTPSISPVVPQIGFTTAGYPGIHYAGDGGAFRAINIVQVNGAYFGSNQINFNGTNANPPVCNPASVTNGRCITFAVSGGSISSFLVGDGSTNCLSGQGTYVACAGGTGPVTCLLTADLLTFTARTNICALTFPAGAKQWTVDCNLIWNMQTGGSGATTITSRLNLSVAPTAATYWTTETWAGGGPTFGNINVLAMSGDQTNSLNTTATSNTDLTIWSYVYRGTLMVPAGGMTATISFQSSNGTGAARLGSYCKAM